MIISRQWAMPNKNTFKIEPINKLIRRYTQNFKLIIDPFANENRIAHVTNDLDKSYDTTYHLDAIDFLKSFKEEEIDAILFDPPYSPRQIAESYKKLGKSVNMETTQNSYWSDLKKEIGRIVKPEGIVITCSWNSGGIGEKYKFEIKEILLVPHGSWHNDTIVVVEKKIKEVKWDLF